MTIPDHAGPGYRDERANDIEAAMARLVRPASGYVGCTEVFATALGIEGTTLADLKSLPLGARGQQLMGLRYFIPNGATWRAHYNWQKPLERLAGGAVERLETLAQQVERVAKELGPEKEFKSRAKKLSLAKIADELQELLSDKALQWLLAVDRDPELRKVLRERVEQEGPETAKAHPQVVDTLYLLSQDLLKLPATTVSCGELKYVIVADKGEMGVRAVREAIATGRIPVVLFSELDDNNALQVRLAEEAGGFSIALAGGFRESYANPAQIADRVLKTFAERFGEKADEELRRAALYPGYGPLAENTAAIQTFRRSGIVFIGPMQDVVEQAGDKRKFRMLAQSIDEEAVTPGIVMTTSDAKEIEEAIAAGYAAKKFTFPGRLKAANGGGGRGQAVIHEPESVPVAVTKVLAEIQANGWDPGVMFEQNIFETIHLEVQVLRDRYGQTRHFGMRDCSEQRASQKIQEEAPPALLRKEPKLTQRICEIACRLADEVGYVGACTVELMYKGGHFYLLEMNTRIQVEHPVTEEAHRIRRGKELHELNLVQLQYAIASGASLDFAQKDVVCTHVAREFRINAESYQPSIKDARDGQKGLFLPNAGVFDEISVPSTEDALQALKEAGVDGIHELNVRFDCGFEAGDDLVNKDPTFGKLIVAIQPEEDRKDEAYELLRLASAAVLKLFTIEGRQLTPTGKVVQGAKFATNLADHGTLLDSEMLKLHSKDIAPERHVGWVIDFMRQFAPAE
ncbi:MAG: ATP-grasp domain-containing protein [Polyangiaceae bacterium]|nr:ATP-grasp domain-containing protein [Polyangiaceae bacterium]